ncbi:MAG: vitamin K epoxide reductase family protein [Dehalococcoidia bacterium]|nr:MAG: vitamin K epoxide reductase family protein [Dehalococcoidia bacterium]
MSTLNTKLNLTKVDGLRWLMILLAISGLGVSGYLMWGYTTPGATLACGGSSGCETVKDSAYARLLGIPMPVLGLVSYFTLLILLILHGRFLANEAVWAAYTALAIFGISLMGVLYSAYLTYLELFVIEAICRWCVASAIIMTAIFFLSTLNLYYEG